MSHLAQLSLSFCDNAYCIFLLRPEREGVEWSGCYPEKHRGVSHHRAIATQSCPLIRVIPEVLVGGGELAVNFNVMVP